MAELAPDAEPIARTVGEHAPPSPAHHVASAVRPPSEGVSRWLSVILASAAGLSAYLALLGGTLLAIRFWSAGLPVTQAVGEVPLATLITTALVQLFVPLFLLVGLQVISLPTMLYSTNSDDDADASSGFFASLKNVRLLVPALLIAFLPLNIWGATLIIYYFVVGYADVWMRYLRRLHFLSGRRSAIGFVILIMVSASLVTLARQGVEPLNMERVQIERPGKPPLIADLVAVRDNSIAAARCHQLLVMPMPASMKVVKNLPTQLNTSAHSIVNILGLNIGNKPKPHRCRADIQTEPAGHGSHHIA